MKYIVCLSHTPWKARPDRTQQLLSRIKDVRVLYFEPRRSPHAPLHRGRQVRPNIFLYTLPAPYLPGVNLPMVQRRHRKRLATHIRRVMDGRHVREAVIWCTSPEAAGTAELLPRRCLVYDCGEEWPDTHVDLESELTFAADVVFAASPGLMERLSPCSDNIALIPNGAVPLMFSRGGLPMPEPLKDIPAPRFCRAGDVGDTLELEPLLQAARIHGDCQFVLVGRVSEGARRRLQTQCNITLLEKVPMVEWPGYLFHCQALFDLRDTAQGGGDVIPPRLFDYLATGKPIVTMIEPDMVEPFPDVVYTALTAAEFTRRCGAALEERSPRLAQRRVAYARQATWTVRAGEISRILSDVSFL